MASSHGETVQSCPKLVHFCQPLNRLTGEGTSMDARHEDCFVVFLRSDRNHPEQPEYQEEELADCSSYEEARQIKHAFDRSGRACVIRFVGPAGGGD